MAEEGAEKPISLTKIRNASPREKSELPTLLRQQSGVELIGIKGKTLTPLAPDYEEIKQQVAQPGGKLRKELDLWITSQETGLFPPVVTSERELGTSIGLVRVLQNVRKMVEVYFEQGGEKRKKLSELLKKDESLKEEIVLSLAKIKILLPLTQGSLHSSIENIGKFLTEDLCPVLGVEPGEEQGVEPKAGYEEKARRLLAGKKRVRAAHLLKVLAEKQVLGELPFQLEEEVLRLATSVNHLKLLEFLEEKGIDLAETKGKLGVAVLDLEEKRGTNSSGITAEETPFMNAVLELVAPISNLIKQEFPHDTAYLLSQMLEKKQAVCAGKSLMLVMILNDLGLDARYATVLIRSDSDFEGKHAECQINLPGNIILALDANYYQNPNLGGDFVFDKFSHQVGLIVPDRNLVHHSEEFSEPKVPIPSGSLREKEGIIESIVYGEAHRLTIQAEKLPELLYRSLARFYYECYELSELDPKEKLRFLYKSRELDRKNIEISPCDAEDHCQLGITYREESAFVSGEERINCLKTAERCFQQAIRLQPKYAFAFTALGNMYRVCLRDFSSGWLERASYLKKARELLQRSFDINPKDYFVCYGLGLLFLNYYQYFSENPEEQVSCLKQAEKFFLQARTIDPKEPVPSFNLGLLYKEHFFLLSESKRGQLRLLEEAVKHFQHYNELKGKPEDERVIKANSHIKEIVDILARRSLKWKLLKRVGQSLVDKSA